MSEADIHKKITSMPLLLQVALWVILKMDRSEKDSFSFYSSNFAGKFKPHVKKHFSSDPSDYGKFVGATLSSLLRNNVLVKLSGDRDKLWTLSNEIKNNFGQLKRKLFEVKTYWN